MFKSRFLFYFLDSVKRQTAGREAQTRHPGVHRWSSSHRSSFYSACFSFISYFRSQTTYYNRETEKAAHSSKFVKYFKRCIRTSRFTDNYLITVTNYSISGCKKEHQIMWENERKVNLFLTPSSSYSLNFEHVWLSLNLRVGEKEILTHLKAVWLCVLNDIWIIFNKQPVSAWYMSLSCTLPSCYSDESHPRDRLLGVIVHFHASRYILRWNSHILLMLLIP